MLKINSFNNFKVFNNARLNNTITFGSRRDDFPVETPSWPREEGCSPDNPEPPELEDCDVSTPSWPREEGCSPDNPEYECHDVPTPSWPCECEACDGIGSTREAEDCDVVTPDWFDAPDDTATSNPIYWQNLAGVVINYGDKVQDKTESVPDTETKQAAAADTKKPPRSSEEIVSEVKQMAENGEISKTLAELMIKDGYDHQVVYNKEGEPEIFQHVYLDKILEIIKKDPSKIEYIETFVKAISENGLSCEKNHAILKAISDNNATPARKEAMELILAAASDTEYDMDFDLMTFYDYYVSLIDEDNIQDLRDLFADERFTERGTQCIFDIVCHNLDKDSKTERFKLYPGQKECLARHIDNMLYDDYMRHEYYNPQNYWLMLASNSCVEKDENGERYFDDEKFEKMMIVMEAYAHCNYYNLRNDLIEADAVKLAYQIASGEFTPPDDPKADKWDLNKYLTAYTALQELKKHYICTLGYTGNTEFIDEMLAQFNPDKQEAAKG